MPRPLKIKEHQLFTDGNKVVFVSDVWNDNVEYLIVNGYVGDDYSVSKAEFLKRFPRRVERIVITEK